MFGKPAVDDFSGIFTAADAPGTCHRTFLVGGLIKGYWCYRIPWNVSIKYGTLLIDRFCVGLPAGKKKYIVRVFYYSTTYGISSLSGFCFTRIKCIIIEFNVWSRNNVLKYYVIYLSLKSFLKSFFKNLNSLFGNLNKNLNTGLSKAWLKLFHKLE